MIFPNITNQYKFVFFATVSLCIVCGCQRPNVPKNNELKENAESKDGVVEGVAKSSGVSVNNLEFKEVVVEGTGVSLDSAKKNAFRDAVRIVVGSFIENDIFIKNDKIIEENLLEYSGGFVETFQIISESKDKDGLFKVKLKAKIAQQTVVEKLRSMKIDVKSVSGSNLKAQLETQETMKKEGGKLINSIMEEYPKLWQAKQMGEPKIANGKLVLEIEVSVDREKYLAWAGKFCKVLEKSADCTTSRSYKKSSPVPSYDRFNCRLPGGNCSVFSVDPCYFDVNPQHLSFNKAKESGIIFSVVSDFTPQGNCDIQSFLFYRSNPLFSVIGNEDEIGKACRKYIIKYIPNRMNINIQNTEDVNLLKETLLGSSGFPLWGPFEKFAIGGDLFAVTPFAMLGGFDKSYGTTKYAIKGILKANLPIEGIDVGKISKITTGFSIEK